MKGMDRAAKQALLPDYDFFSVAVQFKLVLLNAVLIQVSATKCSI
jgi:hypothetical protein